MIIIPGRIRICVIWHTQTEQCENSKNEEIITDYIYVTYIYIYIYIYICIYTHIYIMLYIEEESLWIDVVWYRTSRGIKCEINCKKIYIKGEEEAVKLCI